MTQDDTKVTAATAEQTSVAGAALEETAMAAQKESKFTDVESDRIQRWKQNKAKNSTIICSKSKDPERASLSPECTNKDLNPQQQYELFQATMCSSVGSGNVKYAQLANAQTYHAMFTNNIFDLADTANITTDLLLSFEPQDTLEGMMYSRLIVLQNQFMNYMGRCTSPEQTSAGVDMNINRATKLGRLFNETLDALNKHRRKGEQKVTVQHVNVGNGGQAVVAGSFTPGGGDQGKKSKE
jgi:hypothetical protein